MKKDEFEHLKKKTIKICVFTVIISALCCIAPTVILHGMIEYQAKTVHRLPGSYLAAGIISAIIIVLIVFFCVRTLSGALKKLNLEKKNVKKGDNVCEKAD